MARLIDADAITKNTIVDFVGENGGFISHGDVLWLISKQPTIEAEPVKQEWISVKDRLPERLKEVLICFDDYGRKSVSVATYRDYFYGKEWLSNMVSLSVDCVTHWMPLPEPPKEE